MNYSPIEVAIALSLYAYNVSSVERAVDLWLYFTQLDLPCMERHELSAILDRDTPYAATELPYPTAKLYVEHALERYGREAKERAKCEEAGFTG